MAKAPIKNITIKMGSGRPSPFAPNPVTAHFHPTGASLAAKANDHQAGHNSSHAPMGRSNRPKRK
jgi:hypothetical protein